MRYFDYESAARAAGVSDDMLRSWRAGFEREYPDDDMMIELRLLRACNAAAGPENFASVVHALEEEFAQGTVILK